MSTSTRRRPRVPVARRLAVLAGCGLAAVLGPLAAGSPAAAADEELRECVERLVDQGLPEAVARLRCQQAVPTLPDRPDSPVEPDEGRADDPRGDDGGLLVDDDDGDDDGGTSIVLVIGALALGAAGGYALRALTAGKGAPTRGPAPIAAPAAAPPAPTTPSPGEGQRAGLVAFLVDLRDRVGSPALADEVGARLRDVGVVEIPVASGEAFDPSRHRGIDAVSTADPSLDQRIASVERVGYLDGTTPVRLPEVVVYRHEPGG